MLIQHKNFSLVCLLFLLFAGNGLAADINVIGLFPGKAVVVINGGNPRTMSAGQTSPEGVRLISADSDSAEFEIDGRRQLLGLGNSISSNFAPAENSSVTLTADSSGHFITEGSINGATVKFIIDTGATMISLNSSEARRIGLNYLKGERGLVSTANGLVPVYKVRLDNVKIGDISLSNVDAFVQEGDSLPMVLMGMSFLNRVEMKREGSQMTLIKRY
ncbi:MAG TPA: TIGR02281 family clan AA aspartic protease [Burkholderiales bacterium]|nr:TIGR02281 family clan AA aspartic protease [Burkholderiales bacterium]